MNGYKLRQEMNIDHFYEYLFVFNNITLRFGASDGEISTHALLGSKNYLSRQYEVII